MPMDEITRDALELQGVSWAEFEYACKYRDHLECGDPAPDNTGFMLDRITLIERIVRTAWTEILRDIRNSPNPARESPAKHAAEDTRHA